LWRGPDFSLLGPATILVPPRDGNSLHPNLVKKALLDIQQANPIHTVVMDTNDAEDIFHWIKDELGVPVVDRVQSDKFADMDFEKFMAGLRTGTLKHTGDTGLKQHAMNAVAQLLPSGKTRFERPSQSRSDASAQEVRVIDALTAAAMVHTSATAVVEAPRTSWRAV